MIVVSTIRRIIIAPTFKQAVLFCREMGWEPTPDKTRIAITVGGLQGYDFRDWEVWWLDRQWPCGTHEEINDMENMKRIAKMRGADLRRWWT